MRIRSVWVSRSSTALDLSQFERHPQQEHYLVGLICAIIDGFHFDVESEKSQDNSRFEIKQS